MLSNLPLHKTNWRTLLLFPCACGLKRSHLCNFRLCFRAKNCYLRISVLGPLWRNIFVQVLLSTFLGLWDSLHLCNQLSQIAVARAFEERTLRNTCFSVTQSSNFISTFPCFLFYTAKFHICLAFPLHCFLGLIWTVLFHPPNRSLHSDIPIVHMKCARSNALTYRSPTRIDLLDFTFCNIFQGRDIHIYC